MKKYEIRTLEEKTNERINKRNSNSFRVTQKESNYLNNTNISCYFRGQYIGIRNYHNSCALNCILQLLYQIPDYDKILSDSNSDKSIFLEALEEMEKTKRVYNIEDFIERHDIQSNAIIEDFIDLIFTNCNSVGFDADFYMQHNGISYSNYNKYVIFDTNIEDIGAALEKFQMPNEGDFSQAVLSNFRNILFFRNARAAGDHNNFEFPPGLKIHNNIYKLICVINFIPGLEDQFYSKNSINHFTIWFMNDDDNYLINDQIVTKKDQDVKRSYIAMYMMAHEKEDADSSKKDEWEDYDEEEEFIDESKVPQNMSNIAPNLIRYFKIPPPQPSVESRNFKRTNLFKYLFIPELCQDTLHFHNSEIEELKKAFPNFDKC